MATSEHPPLETPAPTEPSPPEPSPAEPPRHVVSVPLPFQHWDWTPDAETRPIEADLGARRILLIATVGYIWLFAYWTMRNHDGYGTGAFDLGIYDQGLWLLSQFKRPFVTIMGRHLFGDHTSFVLLPLVPFYWILPTAKVLLVAQAAALGSAAVPTFLLAREKLRDERLAAVLAVVYLLHPTVGLMNLEQFHPDVFEVPFVLFALWFMVRRRWTGYFAFVVAALLVKEDVALMTLALGVYVGFRHDLRVGIATCAISAITMAAALWWILPMYNGVGSLNAWRVPFGGVGGLVRTSLLHPGQVITYVSQDRRPWYLWQLFSPLALTPLLAPRVLLIAAGPLAANVLSSFYYQHDIAYHYGTLVIPVLIAATIFGLAKCRSVAGRRVGVALVAASTLLGAYLWGPTPLGRKEAPIASPSGLSVPFLATAIGMIPDDASVSAFYAYVPHVDHREEIYMFPTPFRAAYWGTFKQEGQRLPQADGIDYILLPTALEPDLATVLSGIRSGFEVAFEGGNITLLKRVAPPPG